MVKEPLTYCPKERVGLILENYEKNLIEVKATKEIKGKFNIPLADAIHALLAKANNAMLISRDKHFKEIEHIVETRIPEDFV